MKHFCVFAVIFPSTSPTAIKAIGKWKYESWVSRGQTADNWSLKTDEQIIPMRLIRVAVKFMYNKLFEGRISLEKCGENRFLRTIIIATRSVASVIAHCLLVQGWALTKNTGVSLCSSQCGLCCTAHVSMCVWMYTCSQRSRAAQRALQLNHGNSRGRPALSQVPHHQTHTHTFMYKRDSEI